MYIRAYILSGRKSFDDSNLKRIIYLRSNICADSTRSLLTSERTGVFSVTSAAAPVGYHICIYSYLPSASAAVSPMCHPSRPSGLLSALSPSLSCLFFGTAHRAPASQM